MRPVRIVMEGFGAFRERTPVELGDVDLFALVGATGSGKSTVIDAITFALYGAVARYDDNRRVGFIINQLATEAKVALEFDIGATRYSAVRVIRRTARGATTREARLEQGERILSASPADMRAAVTDLLGLDVAQFNRTVVLPQGRFAAFLHDDPGTRQATLRKLLGYELYSRIGVAARELSTRHSVTLESLRSEMEADAVTLTDERRAEIVNRLDSIDTVRTAFVARRERYRSLDEQRQRLLTEQATTAAALKLVTSVVAPPDPESTMRGLRERAALLVEMADARTEAERARVTAREAVRDGPDIAKVSLDIELHGSRAELTEQVSPLESEIGELGRELQRASERREALIEAQAALDRDEQDARSLVQQLQAVLAELPPAIKLNEWAAAWEARDRTSARAEEVIAQVEAQRPRIEQLEADSERTSRELASAEAAYNELRDRVGILGYTHLLEVGAPCPLCQQVVAELTEHRLDDELTVAEAHLESCRQAAMAARDVLDDARQSLNRLEATRDAAAGAASEAKAAVSGLTNVDEIERLRREVVTRTTDVETAASRVEQASATAKRHREDGETIRVLEAPNEISSTLTDKVARLETLRNQIEALDRRLDGSPTLDDCIGLRDRANALVAELEEREREAAKAGEGVKAADKALVEAQANVDAARQSLDAARFELAALGPPEIDPDELETAWQSLVEWCRSEAARLSAQQKTVDDGIASCAREIDELLSRTRSDAVEATDDSAAALDLDELAEHLASHQATERAALDQFDRDRRRLAETRRRIEELSEDQAVASQLGSLLRSSGFEAWLMQSALQELVGRATVRLFELSEGQYSLVVDDNEFMVRDHTNADELRSARTLSGGETFLASLALALALSEATAELAPEGAPEIESIFLDEGFGTLDPDTLDTVAAAIEDLGASGRMVGIVTHIRDIADRMPVRLEVSKSAGVSSVKRVDA